MDRTFGVFAHIADIHLGRKIISAKDMKRQLKDVFLDPLRKCAFLDGIFINGDTADDKIGLDSEYSKVYFWLFDQIYDIATQRNCFVRVIRGTLSHDWDQLENLRYYENYEDYDFKIFAEASVEEIGDYKILYLPEDYVKKPKEYYSEFLDVDDNTYDFIVGHGMVEESQFIKQDSENWTTKKNIFDTKELCRICVGPVIFGDIHRSMNLYNQFFYSGSFTRLCHGEEDDKGWMVCAYDRVSGNYRVEKYLNHLSYNFSTLKLTPTDLRNKEGVELIEYINDFIDRKKVDKLKLKLTSTGSKTENENIAIIVSYFKKNKNVDIEKKTKSEKAIEKEVKYKEKKEKYSYLYDKNLTTAEKLQLYCSNEFGETYSLEAIDNALKINIAISDE
jgi:DNA repair exonuclease SbcCD nuclease subunit